MSKRTSGIIVYLMLTLIGLTTLTVVYERYFHKSLIVGGPWLKPVSVFAQHTKPLWTVCFLDGDSLLASGGVDSAVLIWSRTTGRIVHSLKHPQGVTAISLSHDGKYLATASYDGVVRIWDWRAERILHELKGHTGTVWSVDISTDGTKIASGGEDKIVRIWDLATGELSDSFTAHDRNIWKVRFSPDGNRLASSSFDAGIKLWELTNRRLIKTLTGHKEAVVGLDFSPDGKLLASGSDDETAKIWNADNGQLIQTLQAGNHVYAVAFSPDSRWLLCGTRDKGNLGEIVQNFFGDAEHNKGISMQLWDVRNGRLLQTCAEHANEVMGVAFSPDGYWAASASTDKTVRIWRIH